MAKLEKTFETLSKGKGKITIDMAHIVIKQLMDAPLFPEEQVFDILGDEEVNRTRLLTKENFIKLIEEIKRD